MARLATGETHYCIPIPSYGSRSRLPYWGQIPRKQISKQSFQPRRSGRLCRSPPPDAEATGLPHGVLASGRIHSPIGVVDCICGENRVGSRFTDPPNVQVRMTLPYPAPIHNIPHGSFRRHTVQMLAQLTTIMSSYESVPDQTKPCRLTHVSKSLNSQRLQ